MLESAIGWIVLGIVAGFIANKVVNDRGEGLSVDILLGIVGAVTSGWAFTTIGATSVTTFNVWSLMVAAGGAVALLVAWHVMVGVVGGAVVVLVVWDTIRRSAAQVRDSRGERERI